MVAFEELSYKDITLVVHADINDGNQTVHFPEMKTTTWSMMVPKTSDGKPVINDETAKQLPGVNDISKTQFTDTISYHNLYKTDHIIWVCGKLMNKSTGGSNKGYFAGKEITALDYFTTGNSQVEGDAIDGSFDLLFKGYDIIIQ